MRAWSSASGGQGVDGLPRGVALGRRVLGQGLGPHQGEVGDRRQPAARVAARLRVGAQLLEVHRAHAGLLAQLALRGLLGALVGADEPAREREGPALGLLEPAGEEHAEAGRPPA